MPTETPSLLNPRDDAYLQNPYAAMAEQRRLSPGHWNQAYQAWAFCDYESVRTVLSWKHTSAARVDAMFGRLDPEVRAEISPTMDKLKQWALMVDGKEHSFLRTILNQSFAPRLIRQLKPNIDTVIEEMLQPLVKTGSMDMVADFAMPVPAMVIADMLGVGRDQIEWFKACSEDIALLFKVASRPDPELARRGHQAMNLLHRNVEGIIADKTKHPQDDMVSVLIHETVKGERLTHEQIVSTMGMMLLAGHETTTHQMTNGLLCLLRNPEAYQQLRQNPDLIESAVEEMVRYEGAVQMASRVMTRDVSYGGLDVPAGQRVMLFLGCANRDESVFDQADQFIIDRNPNPHLGFGAGSHFCVGAILARLEMQCFIRAITERFSSLRYDEAQISWRADPTFRALQSLQVQVA